MYPSPNLLSLVFWQPTDIRCIAIVQNRTNFVLYIVYIDTNLREWSSTFKMWWNNFFVYRDTINKKKHQKGNQKR